MNQTGRMRPDHATVSDRQLLSLSAWWPPFYRRPQAAHEFGDVSAVSVFPDRQSIGRVSRPHNAAAVNRHRGPLNQKQLECGPEFTLLWSDSSDTQSDRKLAKRLERSAFSCLATNRQTLLNSFKTDSPNVCFCWQIVRMFQ